jgi:hypothetical protein
MGLIMLIAGHEMKYSYEKLTYGLLHTEVQMLDLEKGGVSKSCDPVCDLPLELLDR